MRIIKYILILIIFICLFLPWYGIDLERNSNIGGKRSNPEIAIHSTSNSFQTQYWGYFILAFLIAGVAFGFIKKLQKIEFLPYIGCVIFSILPLFTLDHSPSIYKDFGSYTFIGIEYGIYITLIASLILVLGLVIDRYYNNMKKITKQFTINN